jgi:hypothetical protein
LPILCAYVPFPILQVSINLASVNLHSHAHICWWRCLNHTQFLSLLIYLLCAIHCLGMSTGNYTLWNEAVPVQKLSTLLRFSRSFHTYTIESVYDVSQFHTWEHKWWRPLSQCHYTTTTLLRSMCKHQCCAVLWFVYEPPILEVWLWNIRFFGAGFQTENWPVLQRFSADAPRLIMLIWSLRRFKTFFLSF